MGQFLGKLTLSEIFPHLREFLRFFGEIIHNLENLNREIINTKLFIGSRQFNSNLKLLY